MKRRWIALLLSASFLFVLLFDFRVFACQQICVNLNDEIFISDTPPVLESGRVLVPLRSIFEALGAKVDWDGYTGTVTAVRENDTVKIIIGKATAYRNSVPVTLDVPAKVVDGRTMVPLRFVSEALGALVEWDGVSQTVWINQEEAKQDETAGTKAEYFSDGESALLRIPGLVLADETGGQLYESRYLRNTKYLIKFDSSYGNVVSEQIYADDGIVNRISISTDKATGMTTIVIESQGILFFRQNDAGAGTDFELMISKSTMFNYLSGDDKQEADPGLPAATAGDDAVEIAMRYLGVRYLWGGTSPTGFDCSGLMVYTYRQLGITLPRVAADQAQNGRAVSYSDLKPGDLVFFYTDSSRPGYVSHVGMYIGGGNFVHSSTSSGVTVSSMYNTWYGSRYHGARRYWE